MTDDSTARIEHSIEIIRENYATLKDVDRRFAEDRTRIGSLEASSGLNYKFQTEVIEKLNSLLETKLEKSIQPLETKLEKSIQPIMEDIKELQKDIKELKQQRADDTQWNLRQTVTIIVGFLLSGGAFGVINFIISLVHK